MLWAVFDDALGKTANDSEVFRSMSVANAAVILAKSGNFNPVVGTGYYRAEALPTTSILLRTIALRRFCQDLHKKHACLILGKIESEFDVTILNVQ